MRIAFAALAVALGACAARTGLDAPEEEDASAHDATTHDASHPHDAGIDAPIVFVDASPSPLCASSDAGIPKSVCATNVHVGHITVSMTTCFVDLVVHEGDNGVVSYACNGDPSTWADAIFPDGGFVGTIAGSNVISHGHRLSVVGRMHCGERTKITGRSRQRNALVHVRRNAHRRRIVRAAVQRARDHPRSMKDAMKFVLERPS